MYDVEDRLQHEVKTLKRFSADIVPHVSLTTCVTASFERGIYLFQTKYGDLGKMYVNKDGRGEFRTESDRIKVWDIIGRSIVIRDQLRTEEGSETRYTLIPISFGSI